MKETPPVDRFAAKLNATSIGRGIAWFLDPIVTFIKWGIVIFALGYGFFWLFVPSLRHNVRHIEGPGPQPTDCDFMTAPLGNKGCHYEMQRVLIDAQGNYIATVNWFNSRTDGKPDNPSVRADTMVSSWVKVQD